MIESYKFRGNYLNYKTILYLLQNKKVKKPKGFLPIEVDYRTTEEKNYTLKLDNKECLYFYKNSENDCKTLLNLIILVRKGDEKAKVEYKNILNSFIKSEEEYYKNLNFNENENVISATTDEKCSADFISDKGVILLELYRNGFPVPDFSILTSNNFFLKEEERKKYIKQAIRNLEKMTGKKLNSKKSPLIFAIRSAMPAYMPGVTPTFLNIGVTKQSYEALSKIYGRKVAGRIYLNNLQGIANALLGILPIQHTVEDEEIEFQINKLYSFIAEQDEKLLTDAFYQVVFFVNKTYEFFNDNEDFLITFFQDKKKYPSLIFQKMVWTIIDNESYPGVLYSRHSRTGLGIQIESLPNIFGDKIMTGFIDTFDHEFFDRESIKPTFPAVYHFEPLLWKLENEFQSPVTIEFGAESGKKGYLFAVLQLNLSELTGRATLLSAIDLYKKGVISDKKVVELIKPYHLNQIFSDRINDNSFNSLKYFCKGISILPRTAVTARIFFSAEKALDAKRNGDKVIICKESFHPADTLAMREVDAILSFTPAAIHVITECRGHGVPAFLNLEKFGAKLSDNKMVNKSGLVIQEGDWVTISSKNQKIFLGKAQYESARFRHYLNGEKFDMPIKEERVYINMSRALEEYNELVENMKLEKIVKIDELIKIIHINMRDKPEKAEGIINSWFDINTNLYVEQILESEMGSHQNHHKLYQLLTLERKKIFFKKVLTICRKKNLKGFTAGSFMLGRFVCVSHPVEFWNKLSDNETAEILNEYILFEKYMNVLDRVGERKINRARKKILSEGLGNINLQTGDALIFMTLKLSKKTLSRVRQIIVNGKFDKETITLIDLLMKPFSYFYDYEQKWSLAQLEKICKESSIELPEESDV